MNLNYQSQVGPIFSITNSVQVSGLGIILKTIKPDSIEQLSRSYDDVYRYLRISEYTTKGSLTKNLTLTPSGGNS